MHPNRLNMSDYSRWNRRQINLLWVCNIIILAVELLVAISYHDTPYIPPLSVYMHDFVLVPSGWLFCITAGCELLVKLLETRCKYLQPYVVTLTCVAMCTVLLIVHYSVSVVYVACVIPMFLSLVYNNRRVLGCTFVFSLIAFFGVYYGYYARRSLPYLYINVAAIPANVAILFVGFLICNIILSRIAQVISILSESEHLAYESQLAQSRAEAAAEAKTQFFTNIGHEMRTPMNGIIGLAELVADDEPLSERQSDSLGKIKSSAYELLEIINNVLDITEVETGRIHLARVPFDLASLLEECRAVASQLAAQKRLRLYFYNETGLRNMVIGDHVRLRRVILNMLSNAVKFTQGGWVSLSAKCLQPLREGTVQLLFEVSDTGIGMSKEQCASIFEPFNQADNTTTRSYGGAGLGLAVVKSIADATGGSIEVRSIRDIGSKFSLKVELELSDEKSAAHSSAASSARPIFDADVLLCEDDPISRQVAVLNLERLGLRVLPVENGKAGVQAAISREERRQPFDIIFLDIHMPVMDGLQAAQELKKIGVKSPIVAVTTSAAAADIQRYKSAGVDSFISKPLSSTELRLCLLKYLTPTRFLPAQEESAPSHTVHILDTEAAIDHARGVENYAGDEAQYKIALDAFAGKYAHTPSRIARAVADGDFSLARMVVHAEKGAASAIGAHRLYELLSALEEAFMGSGAYYSVEMLHEYRREHGRVIQFIFELSEADNQEQKTRGKI